MTKKRKVNISQSFIKDAMKTRSVDPKIQIEPSYCPQHLKFKYVEGKRTAPSDAMLYGQFFEWHLLGATRDAVEPIIPKKNVRDLRPSKSASKNTMLEYIMLKAPEAIIQGTGKRIDLKPKASEPKDVLINYIIEKGGIVPEKYTKATLSEIIEKLPEDLGEPERTQEDYFAFIQTMPEDLSEGEKTTQQEVLELVIENAKKILERLGLNVEEGEKQVRIEVDGEEGHLDWLYKDLLNPEQPAIYDVKFTKTKYDDWRNGWFNPEEKDEAKIQSSHYIRLYHKKYGVFIPFYFLIFGEDGWIRILKYEITKDGYNLHEVLVNESKSWLKDFEKSNWKAKPEFNRCLKCDFNEECEFRAVLPSIETITL